MKRELHGILTRSSGQPSIRTPEGKTRLVYNLFDGLAGKRVKVTVEEIED